MTSALAQTLNDALPQTQCTRCGYPECLAYAQAGEAAINQCPPGGAEGISRLAALTGRPLLPLSRRSSGKAGMHADSRLCKTNRPGTPRPMDARSSMQSFGLELPGPAYIFGAIVFGLIGLVAFRRGRKAGQRTTLWLGVALMVFPWGRAVAELRRIAHRLEGL